MKKIFAFLFTVVLLFAMTGCDTEPIQTEPSETSSHLPVLSYSLSYYYCLNGNGYVSDTTRQLLNNFGKLEYITPATPVVETHTEIPEFDNNAKGTDPICILLPDLDISKYRICSLRDTETGIESSGWYRIIGGPLEGMMTDEFVSYDVDLSGNITRYKTVNLGKYDDLGLNESKLENLRKTFDHAIYKTIGSEQFYQYAYTTASQTTFRVFTDSQDRIVITTTISIEQEGKIVEADLYAVVS